MKTREFSALVVRVGWRKYKDVDTYYTFDLGDRSVGISPWLKPVTGGFVLRLNEMCTTEEMKRAVDYVSGDTTWSGTLAQRQMPTKVEGETLEKSDVLAALEMAKDWARSLDRHACLERYRSYSVQAAPGGIILHFVALALLNEKEQLRTYLENFRAGNSLGFIPYVKEDMLERALELAEDQN